MSNKTVLSLVAAAAFGMAALTSTTASAGNYRHHGYSSHNISYSCHKVAVRTPYWRTIWTKKRISVPYGCGYKTIKVRRTVKRYKTIWKSSCH